MLNRIVLSEMDKPSQPRVSSQQLQSEVDAWLAKGNKIKELEPTYFNPHTYTSASGEQVELVETLELKQKITEYGVDKLAKKMKIGKTSILRILRQPVVRRDTYEKYMGAMR